MSEDATDLVHAYIDMYNDRAPERLRDIFTSPLRFDGEEIPLEDFVAGTEMWMEAFPDLTLTLDRVLPDGDEVAFRFTVHGTHEGDFMGIDPTGATVEVSEMIVFSVEDGRVDALWFEWDELGFYEQLGVLSHPTA